MSQAHSTVQTTPPTGFLLALAALLVLCGLLFFYHLVRRDLWSSHEARAAQDAQTILDDGDWGLPRQFHGEVEMQKPPLYYWLVAALGWCRGGEVDAWAVRLPAALAALACVLALCGLGCRLGRPVAGLIAAAVLATAMHFTWLARVVRIDMPLTLCVSLALGGFYLGGRRGAARPGERAVEHRLSVTVPALLVAYLGIAAGLLLKGPVAAVLPAAVMGLHLLLERELPPPWRPGHCWRLLHRYGLWWGLPLTAALAVPWYVWADAQTQGEFFRVFFWHHNYERGFDGAGGLRQHPWWFYGPRFALDFLPWSPLVLAAGVLLFRRGRWRADPEARFGAAWLLAMTLVLSCARFKRSDYLLPAFPGAALLLGCVAERWYLSSRRPRRLRAALAVALAGCAVGWWVYVDRVLPRTEAELEDRTFAEEIRRRAPAPRPVLFFWAEAHPLAFHVGRPLHILIEWQDLDAWAARPESTLVVMPPEVAREWPRHLTAGRLEEVVRNTDLAGGRHKNPLVLLRTVPSAERADARFPGTAPDRGRADQCRADGP